MLTHAHRPPEEQLKKFLKIHKTKIVIHGSRLDNDATKVTIGLKHFNAKPNNNKRAHCGSSGRCANTRPSSVNSGSVCCLKIP